MSGASPKKRTLSGSEMHAYSRNKFEDRTLRFRVQNLSEKAQLSHDRHQREIISWRSFRKDSKRHSGFWHRSGGVDANHEDLALQQAMLPDTEGETGGDRSLSTELARPRSDIVMRSHKPWAYAFSLESHNSVYTEALQLARGQEKRLFLRRSQSVTSPRPTSARPAQTGTSEVALKRSNTCAQLPLAKSSERSAKWGRRPQTASVGMVSFGSEKLNRRPQSEKDLSRMPVNDGTKGSHGESGRSRWPETSEKRSIRRPRTSKSTRHVSPSTMDRPNTCIGAVRAQENGLDKTVAGYPKGPMKSALSKMDGPNHSASKRQDITRAGCRREPPVAMGFKETDSFTVRFVQPLQSAGGASDDRHAGTGDHLLPGQHMEKRVYLSQTSPAEGDTDMQGMEHYDRPVDGSAHSSQQLSERRNLSTEHTVKQGTPLSDETADGYFDFSLSQEAKKASEEHTDTQRTEHNSTVVPARQSAETRNISAQHTDMPGAKHGYEAASVADSSHQSLDAGALARRDTTSGVEDNVVETPPIPLLPRETSSLPAGASNSTVITSATETLTAPETDKLPIGSIGYGATNSVAVTSHKVTNTDTMPAENRATSNVPNEALSSRARQPTHGVVFETRPESLKNIYKHPSVFGDLAVRGGKKVSISPPHGETTTQDTQGVNSDGTKVIDSALHCEQTGSKRTGTNEIHTRARKQGTVATPRRRSSTDLHTASRVSPRPQPGPGAPCVDGQGLAALSKLSSVMDDEFKEVRTGDHPPLQGQGQGSAGCAQGEGGGGGENMARVFRLGKSYSQQAVFSPTVAQSEAKKDQGAAGRRTSTTVVSVTATNSTATHSKTRTDMRASFTASRRATVPALSLHAEPGKNGYRVNRRRQSASPHPENASMIADSISHPTDAMLDGSGGPISDIRRPENSSAVRGVSLSPVSRDSNTAQNETCVSNSEAASHMTKKPLLAQPAVPAPGASCGQTPSPEPSTVVRLENLTGGQQVLDTRLPTDTLPQRPQTSMGSPVLHSHGEGSHFFSDSSSCYSGDSDYTQFRGFPIRHYVRPHERYKTDPFLSNRRQRTMLRLAIENPSVLQGSRSDLKVEVIFPKTARRKVLQELVAKNSAPVQKTDKGVVPPELRAKIEQFFKTLEPLCPKPHYTVE